METIKLWKRAAGGVIVLFLLSSAAWGNELIREYESRFTRYFMDRIQAKSILPVISGSDDELRRGKIAVLTVCIEDAVVSGVRYDRMLLVMNDVLFTSAARGISILSHGETRLSGTIMKESFLKTLSEGMAHFSVSALELLGGEITVRGVYERRLTFRVRALMRFTGSYVIERNGVARIRFDDATNDNPVINTLDVGRAMSNAGSVLDFQEFFGSPAVREVRVDHDMVWFSAQSQ